MSTTTERIFFTHKQIIEDVKSEFIRARDRLIKDLATTPDDRILWSPGPNARTPLAQVAHAASAIGNIQKMFEGDVQKFVNIHELDPQWRKDEKEFKTRDQVIALLEKNSSAYLAWLDSLTPAQVELKLKTPFGEFPMASAITWAADHLRNHCAQLEYIQTCYGDITWHY
jgi:hypothetical protein